MLGAGDSVVVEVAVLVAVTEEEMVVVLSLMTVKP